MTISGNFRKGLINEASLQSIKNADKELGQIEEQQSYKKNDKFYGVDDSVNIDFTKSKVKYRADNEIAQEGRQGDFHDRMLYGEVDEGQFKETNSWGFIGKAFGFGKKGTKKTDIILDDSGNRIGKETMRVREDGKVSTLNKYKDTQLTPEAQQKLDAFDAQASESLGNLDKLAADLDVEMNKLKPKDADGNPIDFKDAKQSVALDGLNNANPDDISQDKTRHSSLKKAQKEAKGKDRLNGIDKGLNAKTKYEFETQTDPDTGLKTSIATDVDKKKDGSFIVSHVEIQENADGTFTTIESKMRFAADSPEAEKFNKLDADKQKIDKMNKDKEKLAAKKKELQAQIPQMRSELESTLDKETVKFKQKQKGQIEVVQGPQPMEKIIGTPRGGGELDPSGDIGLDDLPKKLEQVVVPDQPIDTPDEATEYQSKNDVHQGFAYDAEKGIMDVQGKNVTTAMALSALALNNNDETNLVMKNTSESREQFIKDMSSGGSKVDSEQWMDFMKAYNTNASGAGGQMDAATRVNEETVNMSDKDAAFSGALFFALTEGKDEMVAGDLEKLKGLENENGEITRAKLEEFVQNYHENN